MAPRWYRALLRLLPGDFREEYGEEMCRVVEERWAAVGPSVGPLGTAAFWARQAWAVLRAAVAVRLGDGRRVLPSPREFGNGNGEGGTMMEGLWTAALDAVSSGPSSPW